MSIVYEDNLDIDELKQEWETVSVYEDDELQIVICLNK